MVRTRISKKALGHKALHVQIPAHLHNMLKKISVDAQLNITEIIVQYLEYLNKKHYTKRDPLHENSTSDFNVNVKPVKAI